MPGASGAFVGGRDDLVVILSNSGRSVSVYETAKLQAGPKPLYTTDLAEGQAAGVHQGEGGRGGRREGVLGSELPFRWDACSSKSAVCTGMRGHGHFGRGLLKGIGKSRGCPCVGGIVLQHFVHCLFWHFQHFVSAVALENA